MSKFHFQFNTVKKTKEILEKKVQKEIAKLELEKYEENEEKKKFLLELESSYSEIGHCKNALSLRMLYEYQKSLKKKIDLSGRKILALNDELDERIKELQKKNMECKMFETLEEIHFENFKKEENSKENKMIEEFAAQSFIRGKF